jgi:hypothetical protein
LLSYGELICFVAESVERVQFQHLGAYIVLGVPVFCHRVKLEVKKAK